MQNSVSKTTVHTGIKPPEIRMAGDMKTDPQISDKKAKRKRGRDGMPERMLRNTAIACALLLSILTLKNVDTPWSQAALNGIETALTMRIDPDGSLGKLNFVREVIPESTLVFFNISGTSPLEPVDGSILHHYSGGQPWTVYSCSEGAAVRSTLAGTVSAVAQLDGGDWCILIDHGGGIETMYAFTDKPLVDAGTGVSRGETVASTLAGELYYEYRVNGESVDPDEAGQN